MSYKDHGTRARKLSLENVELKSMNGELLEACKRALNRLPEDDLTKAETQIKKDLEEAIAKAENGA